MKRCGWLILLATLLNACAPAPESRSGAEIFESCRLCHGTREMQRGPILDGLPDWYVARQLRKFQDGLRGANPENRSALLMASAMSLLQNEDVIESVAEYISGLPPQDHLKTVRGDVARGKAIYQTCVPCHGEEGRGKIEQHAPPLNVLEDWYLLDQLRKFKTSQRGENPRDVEGQVMRLTLATVDAKDFRDMVSYIARELAPTNRVQSPAHEPNGKASPFGATAGTDGK